MGKAIYYVTISVFKAEIIIKLNILKNKCL